MHVITKDYMLYYRDSSKPKRYHNKLLSRGPISCDHATSVTCKESLGTAATNTVMTSTPKVTTVTYGDVKHQHHHDEQMKQIVQPTTPKITTQFQAEGPVHSSSQISRALPPMPKIIKSTTSVETCVSTKPIQTRSKINTSDTQIPQTKSSENKDKLDKSHEAESNIIAQLTERIKKLESQSMEKITSIADREDELAKNVISLTEKLNHREVEIAAQGKELSTVKQLLKQRGKEYTEINRELVTLKQTMQENERESNQVLTERLEQNKRQNATVIQGLQERFQLKENRLTVVNQKVEDLQTKEEDTNQKVAVLTDRLEQTEREVNQSITTLSERLLLKEEELTAVNQEFAALQERMQEAEVQQQERMQAQETQLQAFCNNALQQMRQQIEAQMQQQIQQINNQMTMTQKLFNAVKPQWLISRCEIALTQHELGNGGWGRVVRATFRSKQVAAKCLHHQIISDYNIQQFVREMQISSKCHHPNLLRFLGATLEGDPIILTELMDTNLYDVIRRHELKDHHIMLLLQDIASAINYLHSLSPEPIMHRDISSSNVLLSGPVRSKWVVKLSDFGSANFLWHTSEQSRAPGNPTYAAPEVLSPHSHSEKMDVYSFGVLLFEICSGQAPSLLLRNEVLPTAAAVWPEPYRHFVPLIVSCTRDNKDERPTMSNVLAEL